MFTILAGFHTREPRQQSRCQNDTLDRLAMARFLGTKTFVPISVLRWFGLEKYLDSRLHRFTRSSKAHSLKTIFFLSLNGRQLNLFCFVCLFVKQKFNKVLLIFRVTTEMVTFWQIFANFKFNKI